MKARSPRVLGLVAAAAAVLLVACDDANPPSPLPVTRDPSQAVTLAPTAFLLRPDQMAGYQRASSQTLSPDALAAEEGNPSMSAAVSAQGLTYGVRYVYEPPSGQEDSTPFREVASEAFIFATASGATAFFADERGRQNQAPSKGGTVGPLSGVATTNSDEVFGYAATAPESDQTTPPLSYLLVARRGRVVIELLGGGTLQNASRAEFDKLVTLQERLLAQNPDT